MSHAAVDTFLDALPPDRKNAVSALRKTIKDNLPKGFSEVVAGNMIHYVVPHSLFPAGYHCDPKQPLPFLSIASQKNFVAFYHMGLYGDAKLNQWFVKEYTNRTKKKPDMGKACVRFKKPDLLPLGLIGELAAKITPQRWIEVYTENIRK